MHLRDLLEDELRALLVTGRVVSNAHHSARFSDVSGFRARSTDADCHIIGSIRDNVDTCKHIVAGRGVNVP